MRIAICPGSFDPVTYGHLDIFKRASTLFDKVIVVVTTNPDKRPFFTPEERMEMIREVTVDVPNIEVDCHCGLLMDYVREKGACAVVKGLRAVSDFEYEFQMANMNRKLDPDFEAVFMMTGEEHFYISSQVVREVAALRGDVSGLVPACVQKKLIEKFPK